jgi:YVTN family beta-propeller protein
MSTTFGQRAFALPILLLTILLAAPRSAAAQPAPYVFAPGSFAYTIIDPVTDTAIATVPLGETLPAGAASPDGRRLYTGSLNGFRAFEVATGTNLATHVSGNSVSLAMTPDGTTAWVPNNPAGTITVVDLTTLTAIAVLPLANNPAGVAITPDGQHALVVGSGASTLIDVDVATRTVNRTINLTDIGQFVAVAPGGHRAYVSLRTAFKVSVVDLDTGSEVTTIPLAFHPHGLAVMPDGSALYVAARSDTVGTSALYIIDTATNTVATTIPGAYNPWGVAFLPDGSKAYVSTLNDFNKVSVIDTATRTVVKDITVGWFPSIPAVGPPIIRGDCACAITSFNTDADLTALGFGNYVPFLQGTVKLLGNWTTTRTLSLLSNGTTLTEGIIDTSVGFADIHGRVIGEGTLVKRGHGALTLNLDSTQAGGTRLEDGSLVIQAQHPGTVSIFPGTLFTGHGTVGAIQAVGGGYIDLTQVMHAGQVNIGPGTFLRVALAGLVPGSYGGLDVTGAANIDGAELNFSLVNGQIPAPGTSHTIVSHATGQFLDRPEGWLLPLGVNGLIRLTYHAGSGSDIALLYEAPPTLAPLADRSIPQNTTLGPLTLNIADTFTAPGAMTITATSSNQSLLPNTNLSIGNNGGTRTLTATPLFGQTGQTTITVTLTDEAMLQAQQSFVLTVTPTRSYYLAEGSTGNFFSTDILLANPNSTPAPIDMTFYKDDGTSVTRQMTLPATSRTTVHVNEIAGMEGSAFSTTVVSMSDLPLMVERTMWWDASGYGASTEKASTQGSKTWYFAEGSQGYFHTYVLLFNPNVTATIAHVTYFMEDGPPVQQDVPVPAGTRVTIDAGDRPELINRSFGTQVVFDHPALAERAMYFGNTPLFTGGAAAAGVTDPAPTWYLAEGATGSFFDTFVLIANPNDTSATLTVTYLPEGGSPIVKTHPLNAHQRLTLNIAIEDPALASAAVSTRVDADRPVVVERSQYWPRGNWYESHASAGETMPDGIGASPKAGSAAVRMLRPSSSLKIPASPMPP